MSDVAALGDMLVTFSVADEDSAALGAQMRQIHDEFIRTRDAEHGYFRMGFCAAKAIERCRQLEGSDGDRIDRDRDLGRARSEVDRDDPPAQPPDGATPGASGSPSPRGPEPRR